MQRRIALMLCLLALFSACAFAQETRAMLFGRVFDPQGSAIPSATVVVKNTDTNVALTFKTNETGITKLPSCCPATTRLTPKRRGSSST